MKLVLKDLHKEGIMQLQFIQSCSTVWNNELRESSKRRVKFPFSVIFLLLEILWQEQMD